MNKVCVKYFVFGFSTGAVIASLYFNREKIKDKVKEAFSDEEVYNLQSIDENNETSAVTISSSEITDDLPWNHDEGTRYHAYATLNNLLDEEGYSVEQTDPEDPMNYIRNKYSDEELEVIASSADELASNEYPKEDDYEDDQVDESEYYDPDEDIYEDTAADENYIPESDYEGDPINNGPVEIDEDEFLNCPYETEILYWYAPSDALCDEDHEYKCESLAIKDLVGHYTFSKLESLFKTGKKPVIFIRNDSFEIAYKIIYLNEEYDR